MIRHPLRSCVGLALAAAVVLLIACGDDDSTAPPTPDPVPDTTPPQAVTSLSASYDAALDAVILRWTAPRDDSAHERAVVAHYRQQQANGAERDHGGTRDDQAAVEPQRHRIAQIGRAGPISTV